MKRLALLFCSFISVFNLNIFAQKEDNKLRDVFLDAEYFFMNEEYRDALANYQKLYTRGFEDNGNINYRIGQCYLNLSGEKTKAIAYLEKAVTYANAKYEEGLFKQKFAPFDAYYYLGTAYRIDNNLEKAKASFEQFRTFYKTRDKERMALAEKEIQSCNYAAEQMKKFTDIKFVRIGRPVSTTNSDIFPVVAGDIKSMVYISKQKLYDALFYTRKINDKWTTPINITPEVQSDGDEYPSFLSFDGKELYLRKEDNFEANLVVSKKENGVWTKAKSIGRNINSKYWEGNACVSKDGKTLYFSSNNKESLGALDIFKANRQPNGDWGTPVNVGPKVNTIFNEDAPYLTEDGKKLYFISQGHMNMGGYDIFYCPVDSTGQLADPVHIDYPINTTDDDLYFYPLQNGDIAFTARTEKGNIGMEDIFAIQIGETDDYMAFISDVSDSSILENIAKPTEPIALVPIEDKKVIAPFGSNEEKIADSTAKKEQDLIILQTIFFDFNSSELGLNAQKVLDYMAIVMKNDDHIKIQFTGYTDAVGSEKINQILAMKRAQNARDYLIKKGVPAAKVVIKGIAKGEYIAINKNEDGSDNPDGRKYNRRVDVKVLEIGKDKKVVKEDPNIPANLRVNKK